MFHANRSQYVHLLDTILNEWSEVAPRWKKCSEIIALQYHLDNMNFIAWDFLDRKFQWKYLAAELLWYLSWDLHTHNISKYASLWWRIADRHWTVNSNYGYITLHKKLWTWKTQYETVLDSLRKDPDSRQAVIRYNDHDHAYESNSDFPCTLTNQFFIRDWLLHMVVNMRSNDMFYGFPFDFVWFALLWQSLAFDLWIKTWEIHWVSWSAHIYEDKIELAQKIILQCQEWNDDSANYFFWMNNSFNELKNWIVKDAPLLWSALENSPWQEKEFISTLINCDIRTYGK